MKTSAVSPADLSRSIIALPPIARTAQGLIAATESRRIVDWLHGAGVSTFMYGGVANFYNLPVSEYADVLDLIEAITPDDAWVVPSIGPDFGKASDQAALLRDRDFPTAILLPFTPVQAAGVATGLRRLADRSGRPLMVFFKSAEYIAARDVAALLADGVLCAVEYGIPLEPNGEAPFLSALLDLTGSAERIVDGAGERTITATSAYGVKGYTSGSGVIAPHLSLALLDAVKRGDRGTAATLREHFLAFEALRATHVPVPVLHDAVQLCGIAETGPIGPFFAPITDPKIVAAIAAAAATLQAASLAYSGVRVAALQAG